MEKSAKVLIVDDFPMIRALLKRSLNEIGFHEIREAKDGLEALEMLKKAHEEGGPYTLMFLDWNMPRMTGVELLEACNQTPELAGIPVIVISAERERTNIIQAMKAGAKDYIVKPFSAKVLQEKVKQILGDQVVSKAGNQ